MIFDIFPGKSKTKLLMELRLSEQLHFTIIFIKVFLQKACLEFQATILEFDRESLPDLPGVDYTCLL